MFLSLGAFVCEMAWTELLIIALMTAVSTRTILRVRGGK